MRRSDLKDERHSLVRKMKQQLRPGAQLAPVNLQSIKLHVPLPFTLVDGRGILLANKGFTFQSRHILDELGNYEGGVFVDLSDRSDPQLQATEKAYVNQLLEKIRSQAPIGELSKVQISYDRKPEAVNSTQKPMDWFDLIESCDAMLHTRDASFFNQRLDRIAEQLFHQVNLNPDEALLALFCLSEKNTRHYSATHCMLVCVIGVVTASTILRWPASEIYLLMHCALTMNIGMVDLQDDLIFQIGPLDISQQFLIGEHSNLSVQILEMFGIEDEKWLGIVRAHHKYVKEPLRSDSVSERLIGLINRADLFATKLSSRVAREALASSVAMKSLYFDADLGVDAMGAAIIKAVGIYRPGSYVKLESGEIGFVMRRGRNTSTPIVAVVINRYGVPLLLETIRNTSESRYAVVSSVPSSLVNVTLNLEKMLALSRQRL